MSLKLFELVGTDESRPFSPFCWRTRMALAHHKGLGAVFDPVVLHREGRDRSAPFRKGAGADRRRNLVANSWAIANYLEDRYQDRPSLFGGEGGRAMGRMINWWGDVTVIGGMFPLIVAISATSSRWMRSIPQNPRGAFRQAAGRSGRRTRQIGRGISPRLDPMRLTLKTQAYLGGGAPNYADYIVFGAFQWARVVSPFKLLAEDDPVYRWREKLLDAFDGMARKSPGYQV